MTTGANGDIRHEYSSQAGANGEAYTSNGDTKAAANTTMTQNQILEIDISDVFNLIAASDYVSMELIRRGTDAGDTVTSVDVLGIILEWT